MDYKRAFQTAAKFTAAEGILSRVRSIPATNAHRARLYANDGQIGVLCELDEGLDLPNATLDAKMMLKIVKEGTITGFESLEYGKVKVQVGGSSYVMEDCAQAVFAPSVYPGFPPLPQAWHAEPTWSTIEKVFHAVGKDSDDPSLQCVCFRPGYVQATDKVRMARVKLAGSKKNGVVPVRVFKNWPAREVYSAFSDNTAYFRLGLDELRMAVFARDQFPDLSPFIPDTHGGGEVVVELQPFKVAVKRAGDLSPMNFVKLEFAPKRVRVTAWNENPQTFAGEVVCDTEHEIALVLSAKVLYDALEQVETPNVWFGFTKPNEPLRLELPGDYVELLWPFQT